MENRLNENQIEELTAEILELKESTAINIMEIGKRLIQIKQTLGHGLFGKYLEETIDFTQQTANKFMKVYIEFGNSNCKATLNLGIEKLFILTKIPKENREDFIENNDIENISTRQLQQAIKDTKKANKKATELHKTESNVIIDTEFKDVTESINSNDNLDDAINEYEQLKEKIKQQEEKIKELKENKIMNKKYKDDMSVEFEEVIVQGSFGTDMLFYNIYFCKSKSKTKINTNELGGNWFKKINVNDTYDSIGTHIHRAKILTQEEKDFVLGECLKFSDEAFRRYEEVLETSSRKYEEDIFNEAFAELSKTQTNNKNKDTYKKFYKILSLKFHPDHGGTTEEMILVNQLKLQWGV